MVSLQTSDFRFQTSDFRLQISDFRFQIFVCNLSYFQMVSVQRYSSKPGPVNGQSQCYLSFDGVNISIS